MSGTLIIGVCIVLIFPGKTCVAAEKQVVRRRAARRKGSIGRRPKHYGLSAPPPTAASPSVAPASNAPPLPLPPPHTHRPVARRRPPVTPTPVAVLQKENVQLRRRLQRAIELPIVRKPLTELSAGRARERLELAARTHTDVQQKVCAAYKLTQTQLETALAAWERPQQSSDPQPSSHLTTEQRMLLLLRVCDEHNIGMELLGRLLVALCIDGLTPSTIRQHRELLTGQGPFRFVASG